MHIGFDDVSCIYRFKKNGTLIIKIEGDTYVNHGSVSRKANHHQRGCIYIRGTYIVCDGKISSHIRNEDVETFAVESQNIFMEENGKTPPSAFVSEIKKENAYGKGRARILRSKLMDYRFLWDWDEEIISVKNGELIIGKERRIAHFAG